jgi:membrane protein implicated in regulation of membrane protease activity
VIVVTQLYLMLSGNFAWLNLLTVVLAVSAFGDGFLRPVLPAFIGHHPAAGALAGGGPWWQVTVVAVGALIAVLSIYPVRNMASRRQLMNTSFDPLHLVNTYGAFGRVTRRREEVILEGTRSSVVDEATEWREYEFKGKPGAPQRRPPQVAPYHLRLDWLMWFVPLSGGADVGWLRSLLDKLLDNDVATLKLLRANPFSDQPPLWVRASLYHYRFTRPGERRETGAWWVRAPIGTLVAPMRRAES